MAHELEIKNGEAQMFSVKETPWHGLGKVVGSVSTSEEAIKLAGLDWTVVTKPLNFDGIKTPYHAIVRSTDNQIYGCVKDKYTPLQNSDAFKWFDPYIESGECSFETAGSLFNGKRIWILARLNKAAIEVVKGDVIQRYALLMTGHDGYTSAKAGITDIRVVCANTLKRAENHKNSQLIRVTHGSKIVSNLEAIRDTINTLTGDLEATKEQYQFLASRQVNKKDLAKFVKILFEPAKNSKQERRELAEEKLTETITKLFESGRGQDIKGVAGTYWALYNATTEYLSYEAGNKQDNRLNNLWFGNGIAKNKHAFDLAMQMANGKAV